MSRRQHTPKGENGRWKTGQRVPDTGPYAEQFGVIVFFEQGATFPPTRDEKESICAHWLEIREVDNEDLGSAI